MPRPLTTTPPYCIRLPLELQHILEKQAEARGKTPTALIRTIIEAALRRNLDKATP